MRNKALAVRSIIETPEEWARRCRISAGSRSSQVQISRENRTLRRGAAGAAPMRSARQTAKRLVSWKEIAGYLRCTTRSVQRWERGEGLPVHRHLHQRGSTAYAYSCELDAWLLTRKSLKTSGAVAQGCSAARDRLHVLPFVNLGSNPRLNLLCDGLTEEIIFQLARIDPERLGVIARTTSMCQKTSPKTISEIGRKLGVTSVMEGSLRSSGEDIHIAAQLIHVSDQTQVWTECFDGEASDPLKFQLEIARQIVHSLHRRGLLPVGNLLRLSAPRFTARKPVLPAR
jgi:TolB-like protein